MSDPGTRRTAGRTQPLDDLRAMMAEQEEEMHVRTLRSLSYELMGLAVCSDEGPAKSRFRRQANAVRWALERMML